MASDDASKGVTAAEIRKIGVIGAGQMGNGIAHVSALAGYDVILNDINQNQLEGALATIERNMSRQVSRGTIGEDESAAALARIQVRRGVAEDGGWGGGRIVAAGEHGGQQRDPGRRAHESPVSPPPASANIPRAVTIAARIARPFTRVSILPRIQASRRGGIERASSRRATTASM